MTMTLMAHFRRLKNDLVHEQAESQDLSVYLSIYLLQSIQCISHRHHQTKPTNRRRRPTLNPKWGYKANKMNSWPLLVSLMSLGWMLLLLLPNLETTTTTTTMSHGHYHGHHHHHHFTEPHLVRDSASQPTIQLILAPLASQLASYSARFRSISNLRSMRRETYTISLHHTLLYFV